MSHAVVAVVNYNGKVLLGKKIKNSPKALAGQWHIPGESVEDNESDEEALIRGIREEAGLEIEVGIPFVTWYNKFPEDEPVPAESGVQSPHFVNPESEPE